MGPGAVSRPVLRRGAGSHPFFRPGVSMDPHKKTPPGGGGLGMRGSGPGSAGALRYLCLGGWFAGSTMFMVKIWSSVSIE